MTSDNTWFWFSIIACGVALFWSINRSGSVSRPNTSE